MTLATTKLRQSPREILFKTVSFDEWLPDGETLTDADVTVTALSGAVTLPTVQAFITAPANRKLVLSSEGGVIGSFKALLLASASDGQKKEVRIDYQIAEP